MRNWLLLERELTDIIKRSLPDYDSIGDLENGDKGVIRYSLGTGYEVLNISLLARELDARGVHCASHAVRVAS